MSAHSAEAGGDNTVRGVSVMRESIDSVLEDSDWVVADGTSSDILETKTGEVKNSVGITSPSSFINVIGLDGDTFDSMTSESFNRCRLLLGR